MSLTMSQTMNLIIPTAQEVWRLKQPHRVFWLRRPDDGQWIPSIVMLEMEFPAERHLAEHLAFIHENRMCASCAGGYLRNDDVDMGGWHMSGWYCNSMDLTRRTVCECPCRSHPDDEKDGSERYSGYYADDFKEDESEPF